MPRDRPIAVGGSAPRAQFLHRLRNTWRLLRVAFHLFASEPDELDEVGLIEDLVRAVGTSRRLRRLVGDANRNRWPP